MRFDSELLVGKDETMTNEQIPNMLKKHKVEYMLMIRYFQGQKDKFFCWFGKVTPNTAYLVGKFIFIDEYTHLNGVEASLDEYSNKLSTYYITNHNNLEEWYKVDKQAIDLFMNRINTKSDFLKILGILKGA